MAEKTKVVFSHIEVSFTDGGKSKFNGADGKAVYRALETAYAKEVKMVAITMDDSNSILHLSIAHITRFETFYGTEIVY